MIRRSAFLASLSRWSGPAVRRVASTGRLRSPAALADARDGVVVVEFALILPVLLAFYVGAAEYCRAMVASQAVTKLSRTVADLTSLGDVANPMQASTMNDILASASKVMSPFDPNTVGIRISAIGIYMNGTARTVRICSSTAQHATARSVGVAPSDLVIPAGYASNGMRLIVSEVTMPYTPLVASVFARMANIGADGRYTLSSTLIWPTRGGAIVRSGAAAEVVLPGGAACPAS